MIQKGNLFDGYHRESEDRGSIFSWPWVNSVVVQEDRLLRISPDMISLAKPENTPPDRFHVSHVP